MKHSLIPALAILIALFSACKAAGEHEYTPPAQLEVLPQNARVVDASYDDVWSALTSHVGGDLFAIGQSDKDSGLLTLHFTTTPFSQAITGGQWQATFDNSDAVEGQALWSDAEGPRVTIEFDGDYVNYAEQYLGGVLSGSIDLTVTEVSAHRTNITADTRFSLVYIAKDPATGSPTHVEYFWSSGQRCQMVTTDEDGKQVTRTMQSTNYVEGQIQEVLGDLFRGEA